MGGHLGAVEVGLIVDLRDEFEVLRRHGLQTAGAEDTRVGDEYVQGAEAQDGLLHEVLETVHVRHVGLDEDGAVVPGALVQGGGGGRTGHLIQVRHDDVGSLGHQFAGDALAEALGSARHDDGPTLDPAGRGAGSHLAAVVLHFPVVDEVDPGGLHPMGAAETARVERNLHRIQEDLGDDAGILGAVTHGNQADPLDQQDLGSMAPPSDVGLDLLFGLLHEVVGIQDDILAFAIDDDVRGERQEHRLRILQITVHQRVPGDLQGLEATSTAGKDLPDGRDDFRDRGGDLFTHAVRKRFHALRQPRHHVGIDPVDLLRRVGRDEDAVVLQEDDLGLLAPDGLEGLDPFVHLLEEGITGVGIFDVEGVREETGAGLGRSGGAHQPVHQRRMQVHDIGKAHAVVQGRFHGRTAVLRDAGHRQVVLHLGFPLGDIGTVLLLPHRVEFRPVQDGKSILADGGQGVAAGLHPQPVGGLVGGIPAPGDDKAGVGAVLAGDVNQFLNTRFHFYSSDSFASLGMTAQIKSSPAAMLSFPA